MSGLSVVVLAAGAGTRMRSARPKPLHRLCGRSMLGHVLHAVAPLDPARAAVVVGHGVDAVVAELPSVAPPGLEVVPVLQATQRGTGDAVAVAVPALSGDDDHVVLVLPGDAPLLRSTTLAALVEHHRATGAGATLLTARMPDPTGYGRVLRGPGGGVERIVEQADATPEQLAVDEVGTSVYAFRFGLLGPALAGLSPDNAQGEYYLTDVIGVLRAAGHGVEAVVADDAAETQGVNDRVQLAAAEAALRRRVNEAWMRAGVTMVDPAATYLDVTVRLGVDVTLAPGVVLQGSTEVGDGAEIGPGCHLVDAAVPAGAHVSSPYDGAAGSGGGRGAWSG